MVRGLECLFTSAQDGKPLKTKAKAVHERKYKPRQAASLDSPSGSPNDHSTLMTFDDAREGSMAPRELWVHAPSPPRIEYVPDYRFGSGRDDSDGNSGSEDSLGSLNQVFESALGLTGVYSRRPSTITAPSPPPSPEVPHNHFDADLKSLSSATGPLSPLTHTEQIDLLARPPVDSFAVPVHDDEKEKEGLPSTAAAQGLRRTLAPGGHTKGRYRATYIPLPEESAPDSDSILQDMVAVEDPGQSLLTGDEL